MSTCKKSFTIASAVAPPFAYYKLDDITGIAGAHKTSDSMPGAYHTNVSNATATAVAGRIGDAWSFQGGTGYLAPGSPFLFTGVSFLIRMWIKVNGTPAGWGFNVANFLTDSASYRLQLYPWANGGTFQVRAYALNVPNNFLSSFELDGTWRRLVFYHNFDANEISLKLDDNAEETLFLGGPMGAGALRFDIAGMTGGLLEMDEIGFWKGTDADAYWAGGLTADWNGGAGLSYP